MATAEQPRSWTDRWRGDVGGRARAPDGAVRMPTTSASHQFISMSRAWHWWPTASGGPSSPRANSSGCVVDHRRDAKACTQFSAVERWLLLTSKPHAHRALRCAGVWCRGHVWPGGRVVWMRRRSNAVESPYPSAAKEVFLGGLGRRNCPSFELVDHLWGMGRARTQNKMRGAPFGEAGGGGVGRHGKGGVPHAQQEECAQSTCASSRRPFGGQPAGVHFVGRQLASVGCARW